MLKTIGIIFGVVLLLVGVLGFIPAATPKDMLLGIFHVNTVHNIIHLLTGAISLWTALQSEYAVRQFFRIFGIVYAVVMVLGFFYGERDILGLIANNAADNWLHLIIAAFSLYLGFLYKE